VRTLRAACGCLLAVLLTAPLNLLNTFNGGNPNTRLSSGTFGRVTAAAGHPRILQFGLKYGF
jgi:hypothetical protein